MFPTCTYVFQIYFDTKILSSRAWFYFWKYKSWKSFFPFYFQTGQQLHILFSKALSFGPGVYKNPLSSLPKTKNVSLSTPTSTTKRSAICLYLPSKIQLSKWMLWVVVVGKWEKWLQKLQCIICHGDIAAHLDRKAWIGFLIGAWLHLNSFLNSCNCRGILLKWEVGWKKIHF